MPNCTTAPDFAKVWPVASVSSGTQATVSNAVDQMFAAQSGAISTRECETERFPSPTGSMCPIAQSEGGDGLWQCHETVPGTACGAEDGVLGVEDPAGEAVCPQELQPRSTGFGSGERGGSGIGMILAGRTSLVGMCRPARSSRRASGGAGGAGGVGWRRGRRGAPGAPGGAGGRRGRREQRCARSRSDVPATPACWPGARSCRSRPRAQDRWRRTGRGSRSAGQRAGGALRPCAPTAG